MRSISSAFNEPMLDNQSREEIVLLDTKDGSIVFIEQSYILDFETLQDSVIELKTTNFSRYQINKDKMNNFYHDELMLKAKQKQLIKFFTENFKLLEL